MNSKLYLVSIINQNYWEKAQRFLESAGNLSIPHYCVCIGFSPENSQCDRLSHVSFRPIEDHWSNDNGIFQHGRWLDALPKGEDSDVYIHCDADIIVQRDLSLGENFKFSTLENGEFAAAWNEGEDDNLQLEARRISLKFGGIFPEQLINIPCYNTGVLAMNAWGWKKLRNLFESRWDIFKQLSDYRSRSQWLINWCLYKLGFFCDVLSGETHCHGHFGMPREAILDGTLYFKKQLVLFRHAI